MGLVSTALAFYILLDSPLIERGEQCMAFFNSFFIASIYFYCIVFVFAQDLEFRANLGLGLLFAIAGANAINLGALIIMKIKDCMCKRKII